MASWNELFADEKNRELIPETAVYRFCRIVEDAFDERPLKYWDLGCGAGRHTAALARLGYDVYATDNAPRAIELTKGRLSEFDLSADVRLADMTDCPWYPDYFHGVLSWNVLHHNRFAAIREAVSQVYRSLAPGGILMVTLKSDKADFAGQGKKSSRAPSSWISATKAAFRTITSTRLAFEICLRAGNSSCWRSRSSLTWSAPIGFGSILRSRSRIGGSSPKNLPSEWVWL